MDRGARRLALTALVAATATGRAAPPAHACATAPPPAREVSIAQEAAVVVWDRASRTEHFIRRAVFRSQADTFGFLVPTPTRPTLAEESDAVFDRLEQMILPELRYEDAWSGVDPTPLAFMVLGRSRSSAELAPPVRVLEESRVGPFEAAVLQADDARPRAAGRRAHGYAERPALTEWLRPYVERHWIVTAFKVADPDAARADAGAPPDAELRARVEAPRPLGSGTVRMTFTTERPFFPYREPRDAREGGAKPPTRSLRVFFVGESRAEARIGDGATAFAGKVSWAGPLDVARAALPVSAPPSPWLTAFEDDASPRPGVDELFFEPSSERGTVAPPPVVVRRPRSLPVPADVGLALGGLVVVLLRSSARRRRVTSARGRSR